jgi:hypothetical protein
MQNDMDYYGISREDIDGAFLTGSNKKIMLHACGMIEESKRQLKNNNHRLAGLNLSIAQLMIEYVNERYENEADYNAANMQKPEYL